MNSQIKTISFGILSCLLLPTQAGLAQAQFPEPFAYPTQNQTPEQQQADQAACSAWATGQTGVDPYQLSFATVSQYSQSQLSQPQPQPQPQPSQSQPSQSSQSGAIVRGAGRGAAVGTVSGAIAGDAGQGAAIGASVGALGGVFRRADASRAASRAAAQAPDSVSAPAPTPVNTVEQQQLETYFRAWTACMQGRGYTVN